MAPTIAIIAAVVAIAVVVWLAVSPRHPELAADHEIADDAPGRSSRSSRSQALYGDSRRPAGPDAEPMAPYRLGGDQSPPAT
ncbi:MAG: hypothetical protein R2705_06295 [Ilumatobacteraceae bacterium]